MTVQFTKKKKSSLLQTCLKLKFTACPIRHNARILDLISSNLPEVKYGGANFRRLEISNSLITP